MKIFWYISVRSCSRARLRAHKGVVRIAQTDSGVAVILVFGSEDRLQRPAWSKWHGQSVQSPQSKKSGLFHMNATAQMDHCNRENPFEEVRRISIRQDLREIEGVRLRAELKQLHISGVARSHCHKTQVIREAHWHGTI